VVCREAGRQVGIAVEHVLDVAPGEELFEAGAGLAAQGVTLLHQKVTGVVDLHAVTPLEAVNY
jgi:two-component system chemotaxis sensor kinase CheA